ncbi:hypothetical protein [Palleronia aestuarii]|uniref:hypothetical protein n=1 Tax=Palleronia aestuarii TaxID=568105 RepID=UPI001B85E02A|nr:hypothetical protein [Palleronia aestuarii]
MRRYLPFAGLIVVCGLAGCAPPVPSGPIIDEAWGPQYAPDDPCKGVVPQMCPR